MKKNVFTEKNIPIVSVVASFYNEVKNPFFEKSIISILEQSYSNIQYIFIDDGSIDKTFQILKRFKQLYKNRNIIIIKNHKNIGLAKSLNKGISIAKGIYIVRFDAGDICNKKRIELQVRFLEKEMDISVLGSCAQVVDIKGRVVRSWDVPRTNCEIINKIFCKQIAIHPTIIFRRNIFKKIGFYNHKYRTEDYELYMRILKNGYKIANLSDRLVKVFERIDGITLKNRYEMQLSRTKTKIVYLKYFFNFKNIMYTLRSILGCIILFLNEYLISKLRSINSNGKKKNAN